MEKYTIDIDKVLDEFEETEALKIHAVKKSDGCVDQLSTSPCATFDERISVKNERIQENDPGNSWVGAAFDINASRQNISNTFVENVVDGSNIPLSQNNIGLDDHLKSSSHHTFDRDNCYGTNKVAANINKTDRHSEDKNTKHLSYDIFYKPREPDSGLNRKNTNTGDFGGDDSPDEILCVAVEENKPKMSIESQVTVLESHSPYNSAHSKDYVIEGSQSNSDISEDRVLMIEETLDNHNPDTITTCDALEDSEGLLNQSKMPKVCRPTQLSLKTITLDKTVIDENGSVSEDISIIESPLNYYPQKVENLTKDDVHLVSSDVKPQSDSLPLENCNNQVASGNDGLAECNNLDAPNNCEMVNIQSANEDVVAACAAEVPRNALDLQNGFGTQDDDSGVSSTEDISGNSPPQLNRESANCVVNENCDIEVGFPKEQPCKDKNSSVSSCKANLESCNITELQESLSCEEGTSLAKEIENVDAESTLNSQIHSEHAVKTEGKNKNEESEFCGVITASDTIASETLNNETTINFEPQFSETSSQLENSAEYFNVSPMETNNELQTSDPTPIIPEENEKTSQKDCAKNVVEDEIVECTEDLNLTLDGNECISPRMQRPTTLDLPSIITSSENIDEALDASNSTDTHRIPADNFSVPGLEPNIAEMIPYVKQQPQIGVVKPYWIPDAEALNCMHCGMKFTVLKRRHHCRGCGKVLCSKCCNQKAFLTYLKKEDRICQPCAEVLSSTFQNDQIPVPLDSQSSSSCGSSPNFSPSPQMPSSNYGDKSLWRPHPNNPDDYCSTIPPLQQIQSAEARPPPTVMVPIGVLKRGNKPRKEPKQVIFSDGIRPGGDLTDLTEPVESAVPLYRRMSRKRVEKLLAGESKLGTGSLSSISLYQKGRQKRIIVSDGEGPLPPVVLQIGSEADEKMDWNKLLQKIQDDSQKAINFALMKNVHLFVKITKLDCCFGNECWCFTSHGLCTVGQDEVMIIMERLPGESNIPRDIFKLFSHVYDSASKGATFDDLGHIIFPEHILGSSDHRGFLFVRPTFQCLSKLTVPNTPYLVAILIHKWEVPWAKVFPLRLMLRMGAECRYYPCSLVSVRHRKPVYFEIGQTIMSVLADLRNFQFTIPVIAGLVVHMEEKKTCVNIPRNRYEKVMKILNNNNVEHVLALGSNFSTEADSHLVCMQKEEGDYQTQAINIENTTRKVTGASFIIFSGALKSTSGLSAKFSIVEDGLLIQISQDTMVALHMALRDMRDLRIECGQINAEPEETVLLQWTRDDKKFNIGVKSSIDGKSFEGVHNLRIHSATDYAGENYLIRWTEVFFLDVDENSSSIQNELVDPCRLAETVAQSCCMALTPYLDQLAEAELIKLGLRVTLDSQSDRVEYDIGSRGKALPSVYMNALDSGLIPVISRLSSSTHSEKLSFELIFHILIK